MLWRIDRTARLAGLIAAPALLFAMRIARAEGEGLPPPSPPRTLSFIVTEFDPDRDGLPYVNRGSFRTTGGDCLGMSLVAVQRFIERMARGGDEKVLAPPLDPSGGPVRGTDVPVQATAGLVQMTAVQDWDAIAANLAPREFSDPAMGRELLAALRETSRPQVVSAWSATGGHAVVIYGYRDGSFLVYDPNVPGETARWPWDAARGFGVAPFLPEARTAALIRLQDVAVASRLGDLLRACERAEAACVASFARMEVAVTAGERGLTVAGTVDEQGGARAATALVFTGERLVGRGEVGADGRFQIALDASAADAPALRLVFVTAGAELVGFRDLPTNPTGAAPAPTAGALPTPTRGLAESLARGGR